MVALLILLTAGFVAGVWFLRPAPRTLPDQIGQASALGFSPDGSTLAVVSSDYSPEYAARIQLWDVQTRKLLRTLPSHRSVHTPTFSPNGELLAAVVADVSSGASTILCRTLVWNVNSGHVILQTEPGASMSALPRFDTTGEHLIQNGPGIQLWNLKTGELEKTYTKQGYTSLGSIENSPFRQGRRLLAFLKPVHAKSGKSISRRKIAEVTEAATGKRLYSLPLVNTSEERFSPDASQIAFEKLKLSQNGHDEGYSHVELWDMKKGKLLHKWGNDNQAAIRRVLSFSPDGKRLVWGEDLARQGVEGGEMRFYSSRTICVDTASGRVQWINPIENYIWSSFFWHDGNTVLADCAGNNDSRGKDSHGQIRFYDAATGKLVRTIYNYGGNFISALGFSPDGNTLAVGDGKAVHLWDVSDVRRKTSH